MSWREHVVRLEHEGNFDIDASLREQRATKGAAGEYIVGGVLASAKQMLKAAGIRADV